MLGVFWEHDLRTVPYDVAGLHGLVEQRTEITRGAAHPRVWPGAEGVHHEVTLSLAEVLGSPSRIDLTCQRCTGPWFVTIGLARMW